MLGLFPRDAVDMDDDRTGDFDVTDSHPVRKTEPNVEDATEAFNPVGNDDTAERGNTTKEGSSISTFIPEQSARQRHESQPSSSTIVISKLETADGNDDTNEETIPQAHSEAATMLIPLLERDEATMQKAKAQVDQQQASAQRQS